MCQYLTPSMRCAVDDNFCRISGGFEFLVCATRSLGMFLDEPPQNVYHSLGDCLTCPQFRRDVCPWYAGVWSDSPCCNLQPG